ncbi:MAG: ABC transporter substrate-binding protein [Firmicutes bacterium]|nr:ABC transporter substrate-binding protein [Bacillota bacterium]
MCFSMTACGPANEQTDPTEDQTQEQGTDEQGEEQGEGTQEAETSEVTDAPEIAGLTFESELERDYAEQFRVFRYEGGYKYFHIVNGDDFLLVPEGGSVPEGLDENVTVLQAPVKNIYLAATAQMALFLSMDGADSIRLTSLRSDGWTFDEPKKLTDEGKFVYAGKYSEPDYEMLLDEGCELAIESTMIYHTPEVQEMIEDLGIPVLVDMSSYESNPVGRMEWIKFYAELIGKEAEAKEFFDGQKAKVESLDEFENTEKTVAFFYISTDGKAIVRSSDDYIPTMIEMAGARYIFKDVADETGKANIPMTIEAFYDAAANADYVVYNASIDSSVKSMDDLLAKDPIMSEIKAVKEGNCWSTGSSMYQRTDIAGDMIMDFHTLFTEENPEDKLVYLSKLE